MSGTRATSQSLTRETSTEPALRAPVRPVVCVCAGGGSSSEQRAVAVASGYAIYQLALFAFQSTFLIANLEQTERFPLVRTWLDFLPRFSAKTPILLLRPAEKTILLCATINTQRATLIFIRF